MDAQHINGEFARSFDIWKPDPRVSSDDITLQSQLESVNLRWNELTTVSQYNGVTRNITTTVTILGNPLHCDNSLAWLARASQIGIDDITAGAVEYSGEQCESPQRLKGRSLDDTGFY